MRTFTRALLLVCLSAATAAPADAAAHGRQQANLSLIVVSRDLCTGNPVDGLVLVRGSQTALQMAVEGRAVFWDLPDGGYSIFEQAAGFAAIDGSQGQESAAETVRLGVPAPIVELTLTPLTKSSAGGC